MFRGPEPKHSQQPPGVVQNWSALQCSKKNTEQCGYDHAPVTRGRMRAQLPLPHGPPSPAQQAQGQGQAPGQGQGQSHPPKPQAPPLQDRGRDPYGNVPGVGDTRYVPWREGGNGGTVSQVTVLRDGDEEWDPGEWWVVSQGSNGEGEGGKKGKKRKREKEGGTFQVPGELLFCTWEEAEAVLREALGAGDEGDDGDDGDDEGDAGGDKGKGGDKGGEVGGDKGGEKEGDTGAEKGGARSKDEPRQPPTTQEG